MYTAKKTKNCKKIALKKMPCTFTWKYLLMPNRSHEKK